MQAASPGDRNARANRVARQLVTEAHVPWLDLEQLAPLGLGRCRAPVRHHGIEHRGRDAPRHDRDQLDQVAFLLVEPGCTGEDGGGDRRRQAGRGARPDQLGDVERVPAGGRVDLVRSLADERCDRALRERLELEEHRVLGRNRSDGRKEGVAGRHLARAIGEDEQRRQRADAPPEDGDRVERRVVCPLDILENEHGRVRRPLQLGDQQGLDLVRGGAGGKS